MLNHMHHGIEKSQYLVWGQLPMTRTLCLKENISEPLWGRYAYKIRPHMVSKLEIEFIKDTYSITGETERVRL